METQSSTLNLLVKLASLGTAGISIIGIFYSGMIVKSLPNDVSTGKLTAVRMYKNLCITVALICAVSGVLNAYFNMKKIQDAKSEVIAIEDQYTQQADSLRLSIENIGKDISNLSKILENKSFSLPEASGVLSRINSNVNSMEFRPVSDLVKRKP
jgi:hypothetical protein